MEEVIKNFITMTTITFVTLGCNQANPKKQGNVETLEQIEVTHVDYYCPDDCEKGKIYHKSGNCPVCGKALVKDINHEIEHHDGDYNYFHQKKSDSDKHEHHQGDGHRH